MRGILIRVGADGTLDGGGWNAPVDPVSLRFVYVPITESRTEFFPGCERRFDEVEEPLLRFLGEHAASREPWKSRLDRKRGQPMHLDPDYEHLTYGDNGRKRGRDLRAFAGGDIVVFYSGLRSLRSSDDLVYAVVGVYVVDEVVPSATSVQTSRRAENAHTRKMEVHSGDIIVRARPGVSGRCARCIPVGQKRGTSNYYLLPDVEAAWGGLVKADGTRWKSPCLNRSATLPLLGDAAGFWRWWEAQEVPLARSNFVA